MTISVPMNDNKSVTANFEQNIVQYTLTVGKNGQGNVNPAVGDHLYNAGTNASVTASEVSGWHFVNLTGNGVRSAPEGERTSSVPMNANNNVTAMF